MDLDRSFESVIQRIGQQHEEYLRYPVLVSINELGAGIVEARIACNELYASLESNWAHHANCIVEDFDGVKVHRSLLKGAIAYLREIHQVLHVMLQQRQAHLLSLHRLLQLTHRLGAALLKRMQILA